MTIAVHTGELFDLLKDGRPWTRAELVEATGMARSTVASRVDTLMQLGLVAAYGDARSTGGRPPALFALNPSAKLVAAIDVGATHARVALSDLAGTVVGEVDVDPLDVADGPDVVLGRVAEEVAALLETSGRPTADLAAIGIGLPGPVEHSSGRPISPPIMPGWDRYDVPAHLQRTFAVPVLVDNDVNIMALGERRGHLADVDDLVLIKIATGIGAGLVSGGQLQRGAQGTAGDLGHVRVPGSETPCRCGNEGCLEAVAAGPALAAAVRAAGGEAETGSDVVALVRGGDLSAISAVRQAGRDIGDVVATLVNLVNPSVVVIGGQVAGAGEHLLAGIREVVYRRSLPLATAQLRIVESRAGAQAGVLGAAWMAIEHVLSPEAVEAASVALPTA